MKLYKRVDGVLHYPGAWCHDGLLIEHWGTVGDRGEVRDYSLQRRTNEDDAIRDILLPAVCDGFAPVELDDHAILLVEYEVEGFGTPEDLRKRVALQERLGETLGWTGLGFCDGGSVGSDTMEACCFVVDYDIAERVVEADLRGTEFADFRRIYREDAPE